MLEKVVELLPMIQESSQVEFRIKRYGRFSEFQHCKIASGTTAPEQPVSSSVGIRLYFRPLIPTGIKSNGELIEGLKTNRTP